MDGAGFGERGEGLGERGFCSRALARNKAVSVACRRPSYLSLPAQREVTQRNGLIQSADTTSRLCRGLGSHSHLPDTRSGHTEPYLETEAINFLSCRISFPPLLAGEGWGGVAPWP